MDATDDPLHGHQVGRFFHGYYDNYCYLPLYIFCGEHLLCAKLRPANIDAAAGSVKQLARIVEQIRAAWPTVRIIVRGDSGFCRENLMQWCEANRVDYVFGLAKNQRLTKIFGRNCSSAKLAFEATGKPARRVQGFHLSTRKVGAESGAWSAKPSTWQGDQSAIRGHVAGRRLRADGQHFV